MNCQRRPINSPASQPAVGPSNRHANPVLQGWNCQYRKTGHLQQHQHSKSRHARIAVTAVQAPIASEQLLGERLRKDFPILEQSINGNPLVYFDNGATSQKPRQVLDAMDAYYERDNSNVHRGVHTLAARATAGYELARSKVARFVNAAEDSEIIFTRGATEAINLVAYSWGLLNLKPGDEILLSVAEHHSNLVPWQLVAARTGAVLRHVSLTPDTQELDMADFAAKLSPATKLVSLVHVSNTLGAILPAAWVVEQAHKVGAKVLLDCCQSVPNMPVDVQALGADWIVASSHKMAGPTGIGFLYGRAEILAEMPPFMGGGEMIESVFLDYSTYAPPPSRFEPGTPAIAEAVGLAAATDYLSAIGMRAVAEYEREIGTYLYERLSAVEGVEIYGPPPSRGRAALCAFNVKGLSALDVTTLIDSLSGVAVRAGHHCTQPLHRYLGVSSSARASLYVYNTAAEVDSFIEALHETIDFLS